ncbi:MAG: MgtC/SapB family protein [Proteobacteria bacterium]|nr:MgtC/SapB family protein [Pseudomonadota bacterium]
MIIGMSELDVAARLGAAMAAGMVMGLNRDLMGKPAGVRTLGLVGLGSALATMAASGFVTATNLNVDAISRAIQGIITGIGFLGAGVIFREDHHQRVRGLTTAASIWLTACFGMVCGIGAWMIGFIALVLALLLLLFGKSVERFARWLRPEKPDPDADGPADKSVT